MEQHQHTTPQLFANHRTLSRQQSESPSSILIRSMTKERLKKDARYVCDFMNEFEHHSCIASGEPRNGYWETGDFDLDTIIGNEFAIRCFLSAIGSLIIDGENILIDDGVQDSANNSIDAFLFKLEYCGEFIYAELRVSEQYRSEALQQLEQDALNNGDKYFIVSGMVDLLEQFLFCYDDDVEEFFNKHFSK